MKFKGDKGENLAVKFLISKGYKILNRNFRCPFGEIDVIASKDGVIVFVEVKFRKSHLYGKANEAISPQKINRLLKTADFWIAKQGKEFPCRFDVITIDDNKIEQIENAFTL